MNSIDNLRDYVLTAPSICSTTRAILVGYIDGIEREVENALLNVHTDLMDAHGWMRYPVDADGMPIHVGDVMEADNGTTFEVEHISLYQWGWRCVGEGTDRSGVTCTAHAIPDWCRHHHAPTVEDVLLEFAQEMNENMGMYTSEAIDADEWRETDERTIAEYAAKLTLRGDE